MIKSKLLLLFGLTLIVIYTILMFANISGINLKNFWFSLALVFIGFYSLIYFCMFRLDSALYYAVLLICLGVSSYLKFINFEYIKNLPLYFISFLVAHLSIFVTFRQNIHLKVFAILLIQIILIVSYKANFLNVNMFITINAIFILLLLISIAFRLTKNLRRR